MKHYIILKSGVMLYINISLSKSWDPYLFWYK